MSKLSYARSLRFSSDRFYSLSRYIHSHTYPQIKIIKNKIKKDVRKNKGFVVVTIAFRLPTVQLQAVLLTLFLEEKGRNGVCCVLGGVLKAMATTPIVSIGPTNDGQQPKFNITLRGGQVALFKPQW